MNRKLACSTFSICVALIAVTLAVFWPLLHFAFIGYDDPEYITKNPHVLTGLKWENVRWALVTGHASNWHPLTWLSHLLDVQVFGLNAGGHHFTNAAFHTANACLLFVLLRRLTDSAWRGFIVAVLFAIHPTHVESVAWISERKDVLSGFFFMLTLLAYERYAREASFQRSVFHIQNSDPSIKSSLSRRSQTKADRLSTIQQPSTLGHRPSTFYTLALLFFALGLMSKPMLVTLPFVLLLLDFWPLKRLGMFTTEYTESTEKTGPESKIKNQNFKIWIEKIPFFALAAVSSVVTFLAQQHGGAVESWERLSFGVRLANATMGYVGYLEKICWPTNLSILYLRPDHWPAAQITLGLVLLAGISALIGWRAKRFPYAAVGWCWFIGMLVPVIGLIQVGNQFMADRYTYLPSIGLFILLIWSGSDLIARFAIPAKCGLGLALAVTGLAAVTARGQVLFWSDTETLFRHCLAVTRDNFVAHNVLGAALDPKTRFDDARAHFLAAVQIQPGYADALRNMGILLTDHGDFAEAGGYLKQAVQLRPSLAPIYGKLALALDLQGRTEPAINYYREALRWQPDDLQSVNNLAWILATNPRSDLRNGIDAVRLAEHANDLTDSRQAPILGTLAAAYAEAGRFHDAVTTAQKAIAFAKADGAQAVAERNQQLLQLYRSRRPYRDQPTR